MENARTQRSSSFTGDSRERPALTDPEQYVRRFGEKHRRVIVDSLAWLDETEPKWKLDRPIGRVTFLRELISHVVIDESVENEVAKQPRVRVR